MSHNIYLKIVLLLITSNGNCSLFTVRILLLLIFNQAQRFAGYELVAHCVKNYTHIDSRFQKLEIY